MFSEFLTVEWDPVECGLSSRSITSSPTSNQFRRPRMSFTSCFPGSKILVKKWTITEKEKTIKHVFPILPETPEIFRLRSIPHFHHTIYRGQKTSLGLTATVLPSNSPWWKTGTVKHSLQTLTLYHLRIFSRSFVLFAFFGPVRRM